MLIAIDIQIRIEVNCLSDIQSVVNDDSTCNIQGAIDGSVTCSTSNDKLVSVNKDRSTNVDVGSRVDGSNVCCSSNHCARGNCAICSDVTCSTEEGDGFILVRTNKDVFTEEGIFIDCHTAVRHHDCTVASKTRCSLILTKFNATTEFLITFLDDVTVYLKVTIDLHVTTDCQVVANRSATSNSQSTRGREVRSSRCVSAISDSNNVTQCGCARDVSVAVDINVIIDSCQTFDLSCASNEGVTVVSVNSESINQRRSDDEVFVGSIDKQSIIDSCLIGYNQSAADSSIISDVDCATSRVKDEVTSGGINLVRSSNTNSYRVSSDVCGGDCSIKCRCSVNCQSVARSVTKSCVAIYLKVTINLSIVCDVDLTIVRIKDQVSCCGGDFGRTINADLDVVRRDVGGSNRLVEFDSTRDAVSIPSSITDSCVAIDRERTINLCIAINIEVTVYVSIISDIDSAASGVKNEVASQSADLARSICANLEVSDVESLATSDCLVKLDCASYHMRVRALVTNGSITVNSKCAICKCITSLCVYSKCRGNCEVIGNIQCASDPNVTPEGAIIGNNEIVTHIKIETDASAATNDKSARRCIGCICCIK